MKKITSIFSLLLLFAATAMAQTVVINVSASDGTYDSSTGNYINKITFASTPELIITASANNMDLRVTDVLQWHPGAQGSNYTLSVGDGYLITEYSITGYGRTAAQTLTAGSVSQQFAAGTTSTFTVTGLASASTTYRQTGDNPSGMIITNISVTVKKPTEEQAAAHAKASGWLELMQNTQALVTTASDYISNALQANDGGGYAALLDKNNATYFHSAWQGSMASVSGHDLQARLPEAVDALRLFFVTRTTGSGYPTGFRIDGSNNAADFTDAAAGGASWTNSVATVPGTGMPTGASQSFISEKITLSDAYQYLRFVPSIGNNQNQNWFSLAEFWLLRSNETTEAAFEMMKNLPAAIDLTAEQIEQINQIDEDLRSTTTNVTYVVKDANGNTLYTSEPQQVAKGTTITTLPDEFQQSLFYDYNTVSEPVNSAKTIEFTATVKADPVFQFTEDATSPVWYRLKLKDANYPTYVAGGNPNVTTPTANADDATTHWAFIGEPYAGFQIVNRAAGTSMLLGSALNVGGDGNNGGNTYATLKAPGTQANETWKIEASSFLTNGFFIKNSDGHGLNQRNNANLAYWTATDKGSTFTVTLAPTDADLYNQLITSLESYDIGNNLHQYGFTGEYASYTAEDIANLKTQGYTAENLTLVQALAGALTLNLPQAGTFLRFTSVHNTYLSGVESGTQAGRLSYTTEADANNIFYYDGNKLLNYGSGVYAKGRNVGAIGVDGYGYTFSESSLTAGKYNIRFNDEDGDGNPRILYAHDTSRNYADQNGSDHANCAFTIEEVTELPLTLKAYEGQYYATFSAPVDIAEISGATIYKLEIQSEKYAKYVDAEATSVPANVGVLLIGPSATATAFIGESTSGLTVTNTNLHPQLPCEKGAGSATKLYLGKSGGKLGFYKMQEWTEEKPYVTNGFKAYFVPTEPVSGAKEGFELVGDEVTGIETIDNGLTIDNGAVYNLQGQKVTKAQKGVFIQNGKKVVVK